MAKLALVRASANNLLLRVFLQDSSSALGAGKTGLTSASSGLKITAIRELAATTTNYTVAGSTIESITTLGTYAAPTATKIRFKEVDSANFPGLYELHLPQALVDAADASRFLHGIIFGATDLAPCPFELQLQSASAESLTTDVAAVKGDTAAVKTQTDKLTFTVANQIDANVIDWKSATAPAMTGDAFARLGAAGAGLTALGDTRIANLDATISSRTKPADTQAAVTTVTNLTNAPTAGDFTATMKTSLNASTPGVSAAGVQAIWDALTSALTTSGSIGKWILDKLDVVLSTRLATSGYTTPPTVGAIADQVWEEPLGDHTGVAGSTALALNAAGSAGDPWGTALPGAYGAGTAGKILGTNLNATISSRAIAGDAMTLTSGERTTLAASIWNALTSGLTTVGSIGKLLVDNVNATISSRSSHLAADVWAVTTRVLTAGTNIVLAKGTGVTGFNDLSAAQVNTEADTALSDVGLTTTVTGRIDDAISTRLGASLNAQGEYFSYQAPPTEVAIADALLTRDFSAVSGEAARSMLNALRFSRNKWAIVGGVLTVYKENDSTVAWTAPVTTTAGDPVSGVDPA